MKESKTTILKLLEKKHGMISLHISNSSSKSNNKISSRNSTNNRINRNTNFPNNSFIKAYRLGPVVVPCLPMLR